MRRILFILVIAALAAHMIKADLFVREASSRTIPEIVQTPAPAPVSTIKTSQDRIESGETLSDIFSKYGIDRNQLTAVAAATKRANFNLTRLVEGKPYTITIDRPSKLVSFVYKISDESTLEVSSTGSGFGARIIPTVFEVRTGRLGGIITDNLVSSMNSLNLALELSDIFAWDIDFMTDIRNGDTYRVVVEEKWHEGKFVKYGNILSAEFINNGTPFRAYRHTINGETDYYDDKGESLRRAFLKAPLSYRRISSTFTKARFHPVLKIYRPHLGVDYAASAGTPVSAVGDGIVSYSGYNGGFGNLVVIKHANGYMTYYGHLQHIARGLTEGSRVRQGQVIGAVGSTGLSTGPHLDYRVKRGGSFINPLSIKMPTNKNVPASQMAAYKTRSAELREDLAKIPVTRGTQSASAR